MLNVQLKVPITISVVHLSLPLPLSFFVLLAPSFSQSHFSQFPISLLSSLLHCSLFFPYLLPPPLACTFIAFIPFASTTLQFFLQSFFHDVYFKSRNSAGLGTRVTVVCVPGKTAKSINTHTSSFSINH